jgi:hypothetical protein
MDSSISEEHISIIGTSYLYPIATLLEDLKSLKQMGNNELQASSYENGYAVSIIVLTILLLESIVARVKLHKAHESMNSRSPVEFIQTAYPESGFENKIIELFIIRDVIVHNHIWKAEFTSDSQGEMARVGNPKLQSGYGDRKYKNKTDSFIQKTKLLQLNVYPTRICYSDVLIVLRATVEFLLFLEKEERNYIYLSNQRVTYQGQRVLFVHLIQHL